MISIFFFALVSSAPIDGVLALAGQLVVQLDKAEEHLSPGNRLQRGRARGQQARHLVANNPHELHELHRNVAATDFPRVLTTTVHNLRGVKVMLEASQVVRS